MTFSFQSFPFSSILKRDEQPSSGRFLDGLAEAAATITCYFTMLPPYQQEFLDTLDFEPPKEYRTYLFSAESTYEFGGAYLIEADELAQFNADYRANELYPGYFLIGSDGGGEAFAIEKATRNFVQMPFIGHEEETPAIIGRTWIEFLEYLQTEYR